MRTLCIPKRSGGHRTVVVPHAAQRRIVRRWLDELHEVCESLPAADCAHGFRRGRSPVTNAAQHVGPYEATISMDLTDFFDHCDAAKIAASIGEAAAGDLAECLVDGVARQGLPTSPLMANIAADPLDQRILGIVAGRGVYTRYADDLTISLHDRRDVADVLDAVRAAIGEHGFAVAHHKTQVQDARHGRRVVTGVAVDAVGMYPTRALLRRLRAAKHLDQSASAAGLAEAARLKPPSGQPRQRRNRLRRLGWVAQQRGIDPVDVMRRAAGG